MVVPIIYRKDRENIIPTYDYVDVEEGVGYVRYYGSSEANSGATTYHLERNAMYSQDVNTSGASTPAFTKVLDLDFDVTFNAPRVIKGDIKYNISSTITGGGSPQEYIVAKAVHWDGTTETHLGSVQSPTLTAASVPKILKMEKTLAQRNFKRDETLRIILELWGLSNPASTHILSHDPKSRNASANAGSTILEIHVPFRLDL